MSNSTHPTFIIITAALQGTTHERHSTNQGSPAHHDEMTTEYRGEQFEPERKAAWWTQSCNNFHLLPTTLQFQMIKTCPVKCNDHQSFYLSFLVVLLLEAHLFQLDFQDSTIYCVMKVVKIKLKALLQGGLRSFVNLNSQLPTSSEFGDLARCVLEQAATVCVWGSPISQVAPQERIGSSLL